MDLIYKEHILDLWKQDITGTKIGALPLRSQAIPNLLKAFPLGPHCGEGYSVLSFKERLPTFLWSFLWLFFI
jgi:hypothetical protein